MNIQESQNAWLTERLITSQARLYTLNAVVKWLTLLILIRKVQGLKLGPETGCCDLDFPRFPNLLRASAKTTHYNLTKTASFHILSN
jgi:hypothetical protein